MQSAGKPINKTSFLRRILPEKLLQAYCVSSWPQQQWEFTRKENGEKRLQATVWDQKGPEGIAFMCIPTAFKMGSSREKSLSIHPLEWCQEFAKDPIYNLNGIYLIPNSNDDSLCSWTSSIEQAVQPSWLLGQVEGFQIASFFLPSSPPFLDVVQSEMTS